jgi:Ca2+-binding EF-hand superfamily protein
MSVSNLGGSSGFDPTQMATQFFKKADANSDVGIDKAELKTMVSQGPSSGNGAPNIDKVFATVDTNSDGKIDEAENAIR